MATPCPECKTGRLNTTRQLTTSESSQIQADIQCADCDQQSTLQFELDPDAPQPDRNDLYPIINPTDEPSRLLDVGQWITLFRVILEAASRETDKIEARRLGYEAAQCLEEALKFYDDNDLPPESAVFTEPTRNRLREFPQQFSRTYLLAMRAKLPTNTTMQRNIANPAVEASEPKSRSWWPFRRKSRDN